MEDLEQCVYSPQGRHFSVGTTSSTRPILNDATYGHYLASFAFTSLHFICFSHPSQHVLQTAARTSAPLTRSPSATCAFWASSQAFPCIIYKSRHSQRFVSVLVRERFRDARGSVNLRTVMRATTPKLRETYQGTAAIVGVPYPVYTASNDGLNAST